MSVQRAVNRGLTGLFGFDTGIWDKKNNKVAENGPKVEVSNWVNDS